MQYNTTWYGVEWVIFSGGITNRICLVGCEVRVKTRLQSTELDKSSAFFLVDEADTL